jgi:hypothetical protein
MTNRPAPFIVKEYQGQEWLLASAMSPGSTLAALTIPDVATEEMASEPIKSGSFHIASSGSTLEVAISVTGGLHLFDTDHDVRKNLHEEFEALYVTLDELETKNKLVPGGARLIASRLAEHLPLPIEETLLYSFGMVNNRFSFLDTHQVYVDLKPGLRLKISLSGFYHQPSIESNGQPLSAFGGTGVEYITLSYDPDTKAVVFNSFLNKQAVSQADPTTKPHIASSVLDLAAATEQRAYHRLYYPSAGNRFAPPTVPNSLPENNATIVSTDNYVTLPEAKLIEPNGSSVLFSGRSLIIPEFRVTINSNEVYVPIGTTLRHIVEQEMNTMVPPVQLKMTRQVNGYTVPITFADPVVGFDLPLLAGDRIQW